MGSLSASNVPSSVSIARINWRLISRDADTRANSVQKKMGRLGKMWNKLSYKINPFCIKTKAI